MKKIPGITLAFLLVMGGCSSSKITSTWRAEDFIPGKYNKIMVLGLVRENDRTLREKMENQLAGELRNPGYFAMSALREYGPKAFDSLAKKRPLKP